jgi:hypothetical protein
MANKRDIKEIKACVEELEERIFNKCKYIVIFENLPEVIDDVFFAIYEAVDRTNSVEYLYRVSMYFNFEIPETDKKFISVAFEVELNEKFKASPIFYRLHSDKKCRHAEYTMLFIYSRSFLPENEKCNKLHVQLSFRDYPKDKFDVDLQIMKKIFKSHKISLKNKSFYTGFVYPKKLNISVAKYLI